MTDVDLTHPEHDTGPVPLSFPAVLRHSKLTERFAHLHVSAQASPHPRQRGVKKEPEGKRWVRRRENAKFTHNPHITPPTHLDAVHPLQVPSVTFPHPLPSYLPRTVLVPPSRLPSTVPSTSSAGLFSLSLRGIRRALRARPSSAYLVKDVESHLAAWLEGGTYLNPDQTGGLHFPGDPVGGREDIKEVTREAGRLVWAIGTDLPPGNPGHRDAGFERYVVHCVARWYGVVSFSKETDGHRLTYLLRPNIVRPDPRTNPTLDTPPTTDASDFYVSDGHSDPNLTDTSDDNTTDVSDIGSVSGDPASTHALSDIEESRPSSPASWSVHGGSNFAIDSNDDDDADDRGFAASMESLSLSTPAEFDDLATSAADTTLTPSRFRNTIMTTRVGSPVELDEQGENASSLRARVDRARLRTLYPRSTSSPSPARRSSHRSPAARKLSARRKRKAQNGRKDFAGAAGTGKGSFYDYLFT